LPEAEDITFFKILKNPIITKNPIIVKNDSNLGERF